MTGRIRTIKPEWLEDELLMESSDAARVLSIALIVMADDYGRGRANMGVGVRVWPANPAAFRPALEELAAMRFVILYEVDGQRYYEIRNWAKHQRVDKPGKPRVPPPASPDAPPRRRGPAPKVAYFIRGATTGLIKIGESIDPVGRLAELAKCGSEALELLAIGGVEADLHREFISDRVHGEWFRPSPRILARIRELGGYPESPIATVGYEASRVVKNTRDIPGNLREDDATSTENFSGISRLTCTSDLRPVPATTTPPTMVDESLRFPDPDAENFNERDLERAVSDVRGTEWRIPTALHHRRQARETAALIMAFAHQGGYDPHAVARTAYDAWRKASKSIDPMVWCADWAAKLPPPPKPQEKWRDLEG